MTRAECWQTRHLKVAAIVLLIGWLFVVRSATAQTFKQLYNFPIGAGNVSGVGAPALLAQGRDGKLYSTVSNDGTHARGTVFQMTTTGELTTLYDFCSLSSCADGTGPAGGVTLGFDGNFYGTTTGGGTGAQRGTVFKLTPAGQLTTLWTFDNGNDGGFPVWTLLEGQNGNLYGVSAPPVQFNYGTFYEILPTDAFKLLADFNFTDGNGPGLPTQGTDGNFYGVTGGGGSKNAGVVYKITASGKITVLHNFIGSPTDGCSPRGSLVQANDGNFYGVTALCGKYSAYGGTIFKISPTGSYTLLYSFCAVAHCPDGTQPIAGLTLGPDGNFYGATTGGGRYNAGTIFKITPTGTLTTLCSLGCGYVAGGPQTPLLLHTDGKLYGTTSGNSLGGSILYSMDVGFKPLVSLLNWSGKVGQTVEILGQGFTGTTSVLFGGISAAFDNVSDTYMTATVPAGALTGYVTVKTFTSSYKSNRQFLVTPQVKSFAPLSGRVGNPVRITGVSLAQAANVTIGGKAASFTVNSDTQVTAAVPAGAETGQAISVTTPGGSASSPGKFAVLPSIMSFSPTSGPVGTDVTILGNSFTGATKVTFGGVAATSYQVINDTQVDALVPNGALTGKIAVTTPGGTGTSSTNFTVTQ